MTACNLFLASYYLVPSTSYAGWSYEDFPGDDVSWMDLQRWFGFCWRWCCLCCWYCCWVVFVATLKPGGRAALMVFPWLLAFAVVTALVLVLQLGLMLVLVVIVVAVAVNCDDLMLLVARGVT